MKNLDEREIKILSFIIDVYIQTGEPVGSRVLSKTDGIGLSPATLRNVMSDLTEKGLISQPHTSAGRTPTDLGYRLYVGSLKEKTKSNKNVLSSIQNQFAGFPHKLEDKLRETIHMLANMTQLTGLATTPRPAYSRLKVVKFLCIDEEQVLAILVSQAGMVSHKSIITKESFNQESLNKVSDYLNSKFFNKTFQDIRENLMIALQDSEEPLNNDLAKTIRLSKKVFDLTDSGDLYLYGQTNMFEFPEFENKTSLMNLYQVLEEKTEILDILNRSIKTKGIQVSIGHENTCIKLDHCSIISATYGTANQMLGSVGVIGPTRMNYEEVIPVIEKTASALTGALTGLAET